MIHFAKVFELIPPVRKTMPIADTRPLEETSVPKERVWMLDDIPGRQEVHVLRSKYFRLRVGLQHENTTIILVYEGDEEREGILLVVRERLEIACCKLHTTDVIRHTP